MVSLVVGGLIVYGACSLDRVHEHPRLFYAMDSLRNISALVWRRSRSRLHDLRQSSRRAEDEVHEPSHDSTSEDAAHGQFARDVLSIVAASTCRNQRALTRDAHFERVVNTIQMALDGTVHFHDAPGELILPNVVHPIAHHEEDEAPANVEDIVVNLVEPDIIGRSLIGGQNEHQNGQTNEDQPFGREVPPPVADLPNDALARDPMEALEQLEDDLMYHAQSEISFSEVEDFSDSGGSNEGSETSEQEHSVQSS
eukprot:TRINITY_DN33223_c0_g1_i2.p1 TRINITY_DN33223_c0_g1~~TRINITY_DN33223_c0_g1_i2.p1  ORF type:complete len:254 (-),score=10.70 TRINITY_DN33223_c0_g1_i2:166-927(-)